MIYLIDEFSTTHREISGKWYIAKPLPYYGIRGFLDKIQGCTAILTGKAIAVRFKEDEGESK